MRRPLGLGVGLSAGLAGTRVVFAPDEVEQPRPPSLDGLSYPYSPTVRAWRERVLAALTAPRATAELGNAWFGLDVAFRRTFGKTQLSEVVAELERCAQFASESRGDARDVISKKDGRGIALGHLWLEEEVEKQAAEGGTDG